ncbi:hypothetical protein DNAM_200 [Pseudomonas phage BroderSalsa]|nr:hypothetical protein DNAM_200 [Pseudomonas phage BroderSalsa]
MGMHFKGDGGKSKGESTTVSRPHQQGNYDKLLGASDQWLDGGGFDKNYGGVEGFDPVADFTQEQKDALGQMNQQGKDLQGIYGGAGMDSLKDALGTYDPTKTGLNTALDNMYERSNFDFDTNQAGQIRQGAQGAGQFGSSRHGIAEGLARDRLSQNQSATASNMAMQDQQNWNTNRTNTLNNLGAISKGLNSGNTMQYDTGALQQGQNQAEIQGQLDKWAYDNNVNLNDLLAYKNLISGDMGGTNTTNTTQKGGGGGGGGLGALGSMGGAAIGGYFGGGGGAAAGQGIGSQIGGLMG